jgi:hypothetical protein
MRQATETMFFEVDVGWVRIMGLESGLDWILRGRGVY